MTDAHRFARFPLAVLFDPELTLTDLHVYGALGSQCIDTNIVDIGQRLLAKHAHTDRRTLRRSLETLVRRGHITAAIPLGQKRTVYQLNSPVFLATAKDRLGARERPLLGAAERPRYRRENTAPEPPAPGDQPLQWTHRPTLEAFAQQHPKGKPQ